MTQITNSYHKLGDFPLFKDCTSTEIEAIFQKVSNRLTSYQEGELIAMQGYECRSLYLLTEGNVHAFMTSEEGKELMVEKMHAPEVLAPAFLYGSENHFPVSVKAISPCKVWVLSKEDFLKVMQTHEKILRNFLTIVSDRSLFLSRKFKEFALQSLATRVIGYLKQRQSIQNLQEVAFILGVARPSLSRALALLVTQGVVVKQENSYILRE